MHATKTLLAATAVTLGFGSASYAADLIVHEPAYIVPVAAGGGWDGVFIGGFVGTGWGTADHEPASGGVGNDVDMSGWLVGVDAGFNYTVGSGLVLGVVGDIAWADIGGSTEDVTVPVPGAYDEITHDINWQGSLRGRIGFDGGGFLPYLTGGLAFANATRETFDPDTGPIDNTHVGWTIGAGIEIAATEEISVDLLYRYSDYGSEVYNPSPATAPEVSLSAHTLQAGLHWNF